METVAKDSYDEPPDFCASLISGASIDLQNELPAAQNASVIKGMVQNVEPLPSSNIGDNKEVTPPIKPELKSDQANGPYDAVDPLDAKCQKLGVATTKTGSWVLKPDYLSASYEAGKFLPEEPYEWHKNSLSADGAINIEPPRKWRLFTERTGHGALFGMHIVIYGDCIAPTLDTLKRVVKAGDGTILATSPPYTRFLKSELDFAIASLGMPHDDKWIQEFLQHEIPCVLADYLVDYVCKPGYPLEKHVLYNTQNWAAKSFARLVSRSDEVVEVPGPLNK